ncbi:hypothetical protein DIPPA_64229 [Diplonema papillatum]|nr:hypothetical protein DIPPA_64229 [Diplonema papillatum]
MLHNSSYDCSCAFGCVESAPALRHHARPDSAPPRRCLTNNRCTHATDMSEVRAEGSCVDLYKWRQNKGFVTFLFGSSWTASRGKLHVAASSRPEVVRAAIRKPTSTRLSEQVKQRRVRLNREVCLQRKCLRAEEYQRQLMTDVDRQIQAEQNKSLRGQPSVATSVSKLKADGAHWGAVRIPGHAREGGVLEDVGTLATLRLRDDSDFAEGVYAWNGARTSKSSTGAPVMGAASIDNGCRASVAVDSGGFTPTGINDKLETDEQSVPANGGIHATLLKGTVRCDIVGYVSTVAIASALAGLVLTASAPKVSCVVKRPGLSIRVPTIGARLMAARLFSSQRQYCFRPMTSKALRPPLWPPSPPPSPKVHPNASRPPSSYRKRKSVVSAFSIGPTARYLSR